MAGLRERITAALAAGLATPLAALQALLRETGGERCYRRERISYLLTRFLTSTSVPMAAPSTTHRFKRAFEGQQAIIDDDKGTRAVTAANLTDDDVPVLQRAGYGHFLETLATEGPAADVEDIDRQIAELQAKRATAVAAAEKGDAAPTAEALAKLKKDELQAKYQEVVGHEADNQLTKVELVKAILAGPQPKE